jgi:hypothetical protein
MSVTIDKMTVAQARAALGNARGLSSEQIDAAQRVIDRFQAERPRNRQCVACSCGQRSEHESRTDGTPIWCCAACHRPATLTAEQWHAEWIRDRQAAEAHLAAAAAAEPKPRDRLREALARRAEANAAILKLERALSVARSAQTEAQTRHDAATEAAEAARWRLMPDGRCHYGAEHLRARAVNAEPWEPPPRLTRYSINFRKPLFFCVRC